MNKLSKRQSQILAIIIRKILENGCHPTLKEMASELGVHTNTVGTSLIIMEKKGYVARPYGRFKVLRDLDGDPIEITTAIRKVTA